MFFFFTSTNRQGRLQLTKKSSLEQVSKLYWTFNAEIEILHHSVTIREKYAPVLHIGHIRQSACITKIIDIIKYKKTNDDEKESICLRTKDKALINKIHLLL